MQLYKLKEEGFKEVRKKILVRSIPVMLVAGAAGISISIINSKPEPDDINVFPIVIPIMLIALGTGLYKGINRQKELFESYTLIVDNNLITRKQLDTPTITLYFNEISQIWKAKNGSISIKGKNPADVIIIPPQIESYEQLDILLQQIKPYSTNSIASVYEKYQGVLTLLTVGLMVCVFTIMNKAVVAIAGVTVIVLITWSLVKVRNNKNVDSTVKRSSLLSILVLASVLFVMYLKLVIL